MTELFDSITHEMMFDGVSWTDITGDVLISPEPKWNRGIMRNGPLDFVAGTGKMTLHLDNSENNSASTAGYYSPGHASVRTGFNTGVRYRLSFVKEGKRTYKYHGRIPKKGIVPVPGQYGLRRTKVVIHDFMGIAATHALSLLVSTTNKTIDEAMALLIANGAIQPLNTSFAAGISTFPTMFDTVKLNTKMIAEFAKLGRSEQAYIYPTGNLTDGETLVSESRQTRTGSSNATLIVSAAESDTIIWEDGDTVIWEDGDTALWDEVQSASFDNIMLPDSKIDWGKHVYNQIKGTSFPREVGGSNEVLFTLNTVISIPSGETTTTTRVTYRDPSGSPARVNGKDMVPPVVGTDYTANTEEGGGGADIKADLVVTVAFGAGEADYTLTNNNDATMYVTKLQFRGIKILMFDPTNSIQEDSGTGSSQETNGVLPLTVKMDYLADPTIADSFTGAVLTRYKDPALTGDKLKFNTATNSMTMYGFLQLAEPGQRAEFIENQNGMSGDWFVQGYDAKIIAGRYVEYGLVLSDASFYDYWVLEVSTLQNNTLLGLPA